MIEVEALAVGQLERLPRPFRATTGTWPHASSVACM